MASENRDYYRQRARQERERAGALPLDDPAGIAHRRMAEQYERRAESRDETIYRIARSQTG
jgi:hypothetical protein